MHWMYESSLSQGWMHSMNGDIHPMNGTFFPDFDIDTDKGLTLTSIYFLKCCKKYWHLKANHILRAFP